MHQECASTKENDLFERDRLEIRLDSSASQLSSASTPLMVDFERIEKHSGRSAATQLQLV